MKNLRALFTTVSQPLVCSDLQSWSHANRVEWKTIYPARIVERKPPRTIEAAPDPTFEKLYRVNVPPRGLVAIENARLYGRYGFVILPDNQYVGELIAITPEGQRKMLSGHSAFTTKLPRPRRHLEGNYYPLVGFGWENYYHWNHDAIMRLWRVREELPQDTRFVVPAALKSFQLEALRLVNIPAAQTIPFDGDEVWEFERLFVTPPIFKTQYDTPEQMLWFRDLCFDAYGIKPTKPTRRIFLSRARDTHLRYINETQVEAYLKSSDFETLYPGELTVAQQVEAFSQAAVVVGTGAAMTNILFAPPGARVLQLLEPSLPGHSYWTMCEALGHEFWYIFGETIPNPSGEHADMLVSLEKLQQTLNLYFSNAR